MLGLGRTSGLSPGMQHFKKLDLGHYACTKSGFFKHFHVHSFDLKRQKEIIYLKEITQSLAPCNLFVNDNSRDKPKYDDIFNSLEQQNGKVTGDS